MPNSNIKIAVLLHLYNTSLWDVFTNYLSEFTLCDCSYTLYVNLTEANSDIQNEILLFHPQTLFTISPNKGMDIGGFMYQLKYIMDNNKKYDYILKLHSKTKLMWRKRLIDPICNHNSIPEIINYFNQCPKIGMIGSHLCSNRLDLCCMKRIMTECEKLGIPKYKYSDEFDLTLRKHLKTDIDFALEYSRLFVLLLNLPKLGIDGLINVDYDYEFDPNVRKLKNSKWNTEDKYTVLSHIKNLNTFKITNPKMILVNRERDIPFYMGTIFWFRLDAMLDFFRKYNLDPIRDYFDTFEEGRVPTGNSSSVHYLERFFSIMIDDSGYDIVDHNMLGSYLRNSNPLLCLVTGMEHSGTTIISKIISSHPDIYTGYEGGVLQGDLDDFKNKKPFFNWMMEPCDKGHWGILPKDMIDICSSDTYDEAYIKIKKYAGKNGPELFRNIFQNSKYIIDKTPQYVYHLDSIMQKVSVPVIITEKTYDQLYKSYVIKRGLDEEILKKRYEKYIQQKEICLNKHSNRILIINCSDITKETDKTIGTIKKFLNIDQDIELSLERFFEKIQGIYNFPEGGTDISKLINE